MAKAALESAAKRADAAKSRRVLMTSGRFDSADISVPQTNPSWTASVSQAAAESESRHSAWIAGTDADAENQRDIPSSSATARRARARHRPVGAEEVWTSGSGRDKGAKASSNVSGVP